MTDAVEAAKALWVNQRTGEWAISCEEDQIVHDLVVEVERLRAAVVEAQASALEEFAQFLDETYPADVWVPMTHEDHMSVNQAMSGLAPSTPVTRDRVSADMMRNAAGIARARASALRSSVGEQPNG